MAGDFDRVRLNQPYELAGPSGFVRWGPDDPDAPVAPFADNVYAFQTEFDGTYWNEVLRMAASSEGPPLTVKILVYVEAP